MTRNQRLLLVALAAVIAVVAVVAISAAGGDDESPSTTAAKQTTEGRAPRTGTTETEGAPPPTARPRPTEITLVDGKPKGGVERIEVVKGERVRVVVTSDTTDEVHLHGYDITRQVAPGKPARISFKANLEGVFEMEAHHAGDVPVAQVRVEPS